MFDLIYHCDAVPAIGMGHLSRGLDVLAALRNFEPTIRLGICGNFAYDAQQFMRMHLPENVAVLKHPADSRSTIAVLDTMADAQRPEIVNEQRVNQLSETACSVVLISSARATQTFSPIDVLIDHMPNVKILGPRPAVVKSGYAYAPVSREVLISAQCVETGIVCSNIATQRPLLSQDRLVAIIGGNDKPYGPMALLRSLSTAPLGYSQFDLVVSPHCAAADVKSLQTMFPDVHVYQNVPSTVALMKQAKAVITTYGNATYESLTLHKPTFVVAYKTFQDEYAKVLEIDGLVYRLGLFETLASHALQQCLTDELLLNKLRQAASEHFHQAGIDNIARVLVQQLTRVSPLEFSESKRTTKEINGVSSG